LASTFYQKLLEKEEFKHIFLNIAQIEISDHLDVIVDFWEGVLFQAGKYRNSTMEVHLDLNRKYRLRERHFQ